MFRASGLKVIAADYVQLLNSRPPANRLAATPNREENMESKLEPMAGGSGESTEPTTDLCMRQLWPQIEGLLAKGVTTAAMTEVLARLSVKTAHHRPNDVKAISNNNCV